MCSSVAPCLRGSSPPLQSPPCVCAPRPGDSRSRSPPGGTWPTSAPSPTGSSNAYGISLAIVGLFTTALFVTHAARPDSGRASLRPVRGASRRHRRADRHRSCLRARADLARRCGSRLRCGLVAGVGTGLSFVSGSDYVRYDNRHCAVAQGLYGAASMAGGGLALVLVPQWGSWQAPFATAAILAGIGALVLAAAPRTGPAADRRACAAEPSRPTAAAARGDAQRIVRALGRGRELGGDAARTERRRLRGARRRRGRR